MPESSAAEMIVRHLDHVFRFHRLPLRRPFRGPSARPAWGISREASIMTDSLELSGKSRLILCLDARRKSHVMEQTLSVIKTEQHRSDDLATALRVLRVAEAAYDAVRAPMTLYFLHSFAVARLIGKVEAFRNDAVASATCRRKPAFGVLQL